LFQEIKKFLFNTQRAEKQQRIKSFHSIVAGVINQIDQSRRP